MVPGSLAGRSECSGWDNIPAELLGRVLEVLSKENSLENISSLRSTCAAWRTATDANVHELQPGAWPTTSLRAGILLSSQFPSIRALNLSNLPLAAAACIWRDLPALPGLQELAISGAMLDVQSVRTMVDPSPDEAAAAAAVAASIAAAGDQQQAVSITHIYSLALPTAVCQLTNLQSLAVQWRIPAGSSSSNSSIQAAAAASQPSSRCSSAGSPSPEVLLQADPQLQLPRQLSRLCGLQQLELAGSFSSSSALEPLLGLSRLQGLTLGPGELDMSALRPLAAAGVLRPLQRLVLRQAGSWDGRALAAVLAGCEALQHWEVTELQLSGRPVADAAIPPEARLTAADTAAVAASLTSLTWSTCGQRLASGTSLLARTPASSPASADAAGAWLGNCTALRTLRICGEQQAALAVLSAPALDALSAAICCCSSLQQLEVLGLGVPMLPAGLSQLQQLHTVSIASTSMARRVLLTPDAALAALGGCSRLRSLTLAGCELRSLPAWLLNLTQLTALQLQGNYIQDLQNAAACFGLPAGLQLLVLSDNRLRDLPASIAGLQQLSVLQLDENYLSSLPQQIWALPALQQLSVRENMLAKLPEFSSSSSGATSAANAPPSSSSTTSGAAGVAHQQPPAAVAPQPAAAAAADDDLDEDDLGAMGVLHVRRPAPSASSSNWDSRRRDSRNTTTSTSSSSSISCSSLRSLVLSQNQLAHLPGSITALSCLQHLDLGHNQLAALPEAGSLWGLTRLTCLALGHNHLRKIPSGITRLQQLVALDVSGNHLPGLAGSSSSKVRAAASSNNVSAATPAAAAAGSAAAAVAGCGAAACSSAAAAAAPVPHVSLAVRSPSPPADDARLSSTADHLAVTGNKRSSSSSGSSSSFRDSLPSPLRQLKQLKQLRIGGQQVDNRRSASCPLAMLLGGFSDLVELLRSLAPPGHQCPVTKAAAAAVAHFTRASGGKRAKRERQRQLMERVRTEPGWVVLPAPKAAAGLAAGAAVAGGGAAMAVY
uniref:Uncharacterized protein n=1 Tax=Tetradesmus obliquus TaxID=3088 RepID=A0A383WHL8_TETOB|eukprot:jgi/Sobl393_1/5006/SZX76639.1